MAPNDAEMPARQGLSDDMDQIAKDLAGLRADLQGLAGDVKRLEATRSRTCRTPPMRHSRRSRQQCAAIR